MLYYYILRYKWYTFYALACHTLYTKFGLITFQLLHFQCCRNISITSFGLKPFCFVFANITSSGTSFFSQPLSSFILMCSLYEISVAACLESLEHWQRRYSHSHLFPFVTLFTFSLNSAKSCHFLKQWNQPLLSVRFFFSLLVMLCFSQCST